jgi:PAS domain S-box-containing protein
MPARKEGRTPTHEPATGAAPARRGATAAPETSSAIARAEAELRDRESRYRNLVDVSPDAILVHRRDRIVLANPACARLFGVEDPEQLLGRRPLELFHPDFHDRIRERIAGIMGGKPAPRIEERIVRVDGEVRDVEVVAAAFPDCGEVSIQVILRDITERKTTETALRESEQRYRALFTNMSEGFALGEVIRDERGVAHDFRFVEMNDAFEQQSGLTRQAIQGRPMRQVLPHLEESWLETYCRVATTGAPTRFESYNRDLDRHFSVFAFSPSPGRFAIIFMDVTERKRKDDALRQSEQQLRVATLAAEIGVWSWIPGTSEVAVSSNWRQLFGIGPDVPVTFETWRGAVHPEDRDRAARELNESVEHHREFDTEYRVLQPDGGVRWIVDRGRASYDADGRPTIMGGVNIDITRRKLAEEALREADRRKDEFLGMLSHELRNPLAPIRNSVYILQHGDPTSEQTARARGVIERQTQHLTRLVDDLLDVTRVARGKIDLRRIRVDLRELVLAAADDFRATLEERGVTFETSLPYSKVWVSADATRLSQIIGNLLHNASKFTRDGDSVTLSLRVAGPEAQLSVRDTGVGIDPALIPQLFTPFFQAERTLARTDGGLGLGLALVKGLVELHGGSVRGTSAGRGEGAEFVVSLPLIPAAASEPAQRPTPRGAGGRRILIVDDNRDAAESLAQIVEMLGHTVEVAFDGATAVERVRATRPDVVLCDIGLPGMSGYDVARAVRALGEPVRLVAISGYAQPEDVLAAREAGFDHHMAKPCEPDELLRQLE